VIVSDKQFVVDGNPVSVDVPDDMPLLWALRDVLGVRGPKYGCGIGVCHACTSHLDGNEILACITPVSEVVDKEVTTIAGLADGDRLHPVQQAWIDEDVAQCGYCQPGQIMAAVALLKRIPNPTDADIDTIENVCRCGTYYRIRRAIKAAARAMQEG
jgi:isoquinoline 1-oxidoreductase alpha subunit